MDTLHQVISDQLELAHPVARQNKLAAESTLTNGELFLAILNKDLSATLSSAASRRQPVYVAFSCGAGACQIREFEA
jgi:hypothetical protein